MPELISHHLQKGLFGKYICFELFLQGTLISILCLLLCALVHFPRQVPSDRLSQLDSIHAVRASGVCWQSPGKRVSSSLRWQYIEGLSSLHPREHLL